MTRNRISFFLAGLLALLAASACATSYPKCLGDCETGRGTLIRKSGDHYVGEFQNGLYHGYGTLNEAGGGHYTGEWQDGLRHGRGTQMQPGGAQQTGLWENNRLVEPSPFRVESAAGP
ncbi:hypothetical protein [Nitrospina watsonii]|uniref:MORN repeat-containing protein n=1 Tax=Nitrospina watsonii TaxID=1323948 RepID=A0ABN8VVW4_9BACT|nr:hypothetical protein [Nitrospina watsonii]CAI2716969.1 exported protein of unknown function [Nitrospina watsonii]